MKKILTICLLALGLNTNAQQATTTERYGKTLNIGTGIGYYGYLGRPLLTGTINYEFDVAKNFTLAPFIGLYSYQRDYYWTIKPLWTRCP